METTTNVLENTTFFSNHTTRNRTLKLCRDDLVSNFRIYTELSLASVGAIANLLSLTVLYQVKRPLDQFKLLLVFLSVSDLMATFPVLGRELWIVFDCLSIRPNNCIYAVLDNVQVASEFLPLAATIAIVLNQFLTVKFPLTYGCLASTKRVKLFIAFICIVASVLFALPHIAIAGKLTQGHKFCRVVASRLFVDAFYWEYFCTFVTTNIAAVTLYLVFYLEIRKVLRTPATTSTTSYAAASDTKMTYTIALLLVTVVVLWIPGCISCIYHISSFRKNITFATFSWYHNVCEIFFLSNTVCDPVIYGVRLGFVRAAYRKLWKRITGRPMYDNATGVTFSSRRSLRKRRFSGKVDDKLKPDYCQQEADKNLMAMCAIES